MAIDRFDSSCNYDEAISKLTKLFEDMKDRIYNNEAMLVGIVGLSQSGKTRISTSLEKKLKVAITVDGDKYQHGREVDMPTYHRLLEDARAGREINLEFYKNVWEYDAMKAQLLDPVLIFNKSDKEETSLELKDVIDTATKKSDSLHNEEYTINRNSIVFVPSMFLRHLHDKFHYMIMLDITPETSIARKIERDIKKGVKRDPQVTRDMVSLVEFPTIEYQKQKYQVNEGIALNTNDFNAIY